MKKYLLILMVILVSLSIYSQQVNKNYVVVEIGTGTWCTYCPGAAMGADDLVENGHQVAVIENHNGDPYAYAASNARNTYYAITGYPTAWFNGLNPEVGGSHTQSMYNAYLDNYNNAIAVMSDFTMDLSATHDGLDYDVTIELDEVGTYTGENLVVHLAITESHIEYAWQGQTELNFVSRAMYPDQNGTAYTGGQSTINLSFTASANWDLSNCELVAFVQDIGTKQILQSDKLTLAEPTGTNNVALTEITEISDVCEGSISPSIKVKNFGSTDITSLTIDYSINSGATTGTFNWTGDAIPFNAYATIDFDEITFDLLADNTINFDITQVNGTTDEDPSNNTGNTSFDEAPSGTTLLYLSIHTDDWGEECTWNIKNSAGAVVFSGGPYGDNQTITLTLFTGLDCYTFNIIDAYGDGGGSINLEDSEGTVLYSSGGNYGSGESQLFNTFSFLPEVAFEPVDGETEISVSGNMTLTFNQPMRKVDDSAITGSNISDFVTLTDPTKANIPFSGSVNSDKTIVTINPTDDLPDLTEITVTILDNTIENNFDDALAESYATFTTVEILNVDEIDDIELFPNPVNDYLSISGARFATITLTDMFGKQVLSQAIESNNEKINLTHLNSGVYIIMIDLSGKQIERKITLVK